MSVIRSMIAILALSACQAQPAPQAPSVQHHYRAKALTPAQERERAKFDDQLRLLQQDLRKLQFRTQPPTGAGIE